MIGPTTSTLIHDLCRLPASLREPLLFGLALFVLPPALPLSPRDEFLLPCAAVSLLFLWGIFGPRKAALEKLDPGYRKRRYQFLPVVVVAPLWEEFLFRGFFLVLLSYVLGTPLAIVGAAMIWAMLHDRPLLLPMDIALGIALGWMALVWGLWSAILAHAILNFRAWWCFWRSPPP